MKTLVLATLVAVAGCGGGGGGGSVRSLTPPDGKAGDSPRLSPDGKSIAYKLNRNGAAEPDQIVVVGLDGSGSHMVASAEFIDGLVWAPDGSKLYFTSNLGVQSVPLAGGTPTQVGDSFAALNPDISPDGKTLVWGVNGGSLETLDLSTAGARKVTLGPGSAPRFSHDGKRIAFLEGPKYTLKVMDLATKQVTELVDTDSYLSTVAWYADDQHIAYLSKQGIEKISLADKSHQLLRDEFAAKDMDMTADGKTVVYAINGQELIFIATF